MPKLEIGMPRNANGFSLIEILVVIVIISLLSSVAILAFGDFGQSRKAKIAAEQFVHVIGILEKKAILDMATYGIKIEKSAYTVYPLDSSMSNPTTHPLFGRHSLPASIFFLENSIHHQQQMPDIMISNAGDVSGFQLWLGTANEPKIVEIYHGPDGQLMIKNYEK